MERISNVVIALHCGRFDHMNVILTRSPIDFDQEEMSRNSKSSAGTHWFPTFHLTNTINSEIGF